MNSVQDLAMLPATMYSDPIIMHRLRIMRYTRRPARSLPIIRRFDNCLRAKIDRLYCLRRTKYVTRLGLYYWVNQHDENCEDCKQLSGHAKNGRDSNYVSMIKTNPINSGGLNFSNLATSLNVDLSCFSSFVSSVFNRKVYHETRAASHLSAEENAMVEEDRSIHLAPLTLSLKDFSDSPREVPSDMEDFEDGVAVADDFAVVDVMATHRMFTIDNPYPAMYEQIRTAELAALQELEAFPASEEHTYRDCDEESEEDWQADAPSQEKSKKSCIKLSTSKTTIGTTGQRMAIKLPVRKTRTRLSA